MTQCITNTINSTSIRDIVNSFNPHLFKINNRFKNMQILNLSFIANTNIKVLKAYGNNYYLNVIDSSKFKFCIICPVELFKNSCKHYDISEKSSVNVGIEEIIFDKNTKLTIKINSISRHGVSLIEAKKQNIVKYCKKKGYYSRIKKKLPNFVSSIALITTSTGNTQSDILNQIGLKNDCLSLFKCKSNEADIANTLKNITSSNAFQIAVLFRGGNEDEHMLKFSSIEILDIVASSPIFIASAIGHESDHSIIDDIVDMSFATPSSFAKEIYSHNKMFKKNLEVTKMNIKISSMNYLKNISDIVKYKKKEINNNIHNAIKTIRNKKIITIFSTIIFILCITVASLLLVNR